MPGEGWCDRAESGVAVKGNAPGRSLAVTRVKDGVEGDSVLLS